MSHDLLSDVLRPPDARQRARRWYLLPVSLAAHAVAAIAMVIIPLAAEVELPQPARLSNRYVDVMPAAVPPSVPPPRGPAPSRAVAPSEAPSSIQPEPDMPVSSTASPVGVPIPGPPGAPDGLDIGQLGSSVLVFEPPKVEPPREPVRIGGVIREPRKVVHVPPVYPPLAIAAQKEGVVILEAVIDERGNVVRLKVLRSEPLLDGAAIAAVERWRYTPTLLNNVPVPVLMTITVRFSLR
jgi:protein TonB